MTSLIGRDRELGLIETFLAAVDEGLSGLVLRGEAGIGKTALWEAGVEDATRRFGRILVFRGIEAERSLSFAALSELLGPVFDDVLSSLATPRRRALEIALLRAEPVGESPDPLAIGLAVLDTLSILAGQEPLLVALDDAQWVDPASAAVIQIALRRLRRQRVGLLVTMRAGRKDAAPLVPERLLPEGSLEQVTVGPLSMGAVHRLLKEQLGLELSRPELAWVQEATAGNPFFALELGRECVRTGTRPRPGQSFRIPENLRELLGDRLGRLPAASSDLLLEIAALARPSIQILTSVEGDRERVLRGLEVAASEGVVVADDSHVRFAHPLLASICYEEAPAWKRRAVHEALAGVVTDVEERARHRALAAERPDAAVADELESAAERAVGRGAPAAAAELSELSADLTPDDPTAERRRRLRAAGFHRLAGDAERAVITLERLLEQVPSGVERADILIELAQSQRGGPCANIPVCNEALAEAEGDDFRAATILTLRAGNHLLEANAEAGLTDGRAGLEKAERVGDEALLVRAIAYLSQAETYSGDVTPGLLERGLDLEERLALHLEWNYSPRYVLGRRVMRLGDLERSRALLRDVEARALERGDEVSRVMTLWPLTIVEWMAGSWEQALELAQLAYELTEQTQHPHALTWVGRAKALVEADLGMVEQARRSAEESLGFATASSSDASVIAITGVLGRLELALGNLESAAGYLHELPARLLAGSIHDPGLTVWADTIETLIAVGEHELATRYLEPHEAHATRLGSTWALAGVARTRGLLAAATGEPTAAFAAFDQSLAKAAPFPFERGRTLLCSGVVRRQAQQKRRSRDDLEQALAIFGRLGARLWVDRTQTELRRISGRPPAPEELTEAERRVAELAGKGRSNRQIAAELYMGLSTVESHLSSVYRKLGVRRAELAASLSTPDAAGPNAGVGAAQSEGFPGIGRNR